MICLQALFLVGYCVNLFLCLQASFERENKKIKAFFLSFLISIFWPILLVVIFCDMRKVNKLTR